jgi:hypothetical protein
MCSNLGKRLLLAFPHFLLMSFTATFQDIIGGFLDPSAAAASPTEEPESDEEERPDYEAYYRDMDDKFSDEEDDNHASAEDAPSHKKKREQADSPLVEDGQIVVDLEEVLSPEEFEALYAQAPNANAGAGIDEERAAGFADDAQVVDEQYEADAGKEDEELGDLNPEDMALFMSQGLPDSGH